MDHPRASVSLAAANDALYVAGGAQKLFTHPQLSMKAVKTSDFFNLHSGHWAPIPPIPTARSAAMTAVVGNDIYVVGGLFGELSSATVEIYNTTSNYWRRGHHIPNPRCCGAIVAYGDQIWVLGGWNEEALDVVEILDTKTGVWTVGTKLTVPRTFFAAAAWGSRVYIVGGQLAYDKNSYVQYIDTQRPDNGWISVSSDFEGKTAPMLRGFAYASLGQLLVLMGGLSTNTLHSVSDVMAYDLAGNKFIALPSLPNNCLYGDAAVVDDIVYLMGCFEEVRDAEVLPHVMSLKFEGVEPPIPNPVMVRANQGWGWSLLWYMFMLALLYFGWGLFINSRKGLAGIELLPHHQFWQELPSLCIDGFVFLYITVAIPVMERWSGPASQASRPSYSYNPVQEEDDGMYHPSQPGAASSNGDGPSGAYGAV